MIGCPDCAQLTGGDCGKHGPTFTPSPIVLTSEPLAGWRCPCCTAIYAPGVTECWRCSPPVLPMLNGGHTCSQDSARVTALSPEEWDRLIENPEPPTRELVDLFREKSEADNRGGGE